LVALREPAEDFDDALRQLAFYIGEGADRSASSVPEGADLEPECKTACKTFQIPGVNSVQ
ncbi:MAG: hypothetical protein ABSG40_24170, partial [Terriglobales bacterium]